MTDPAKATEEALLNWKQDKTLRESFAEAIRKAQQEGIAEGRRLAAADARPGVDRDKVLELLDAAADRGVYGIGSIIAAVRLLVGEK